MEDRQVFENSILRFIGWLDRNGTSGYDPYDLWSTRLGVHSRRLYYRYGTVAAIMAASIVTADRLMPRAARIGITKKSYATSHAHLALGFLDLYESAFKGEIWLSRAIGLGEELDKLKIDGYSGDCWGYPFDWENRRGMWPRNTPLITVTPYGFEANLRLYGMTGNDLYRERAISVVEFALHDLKNIRRPNDGIASSYSPIDESLVINASAYRASVLMTGEKMFSHASAGDLGRSLVKFVLNSQREDGSWPYALESTGDDFVDHFHTCFVLKNLTKIFDITNDPDIWAAIGKGYSYYEKALFYSDGLPKPFAGVGGRYVKYNLYDFAEAINLGILLRNHLPRAFERSLYIARVAAERFQLADGHFVTSVDRLGFSNRFAYIRWPQAQLFHSLTSLFSALN